MPGAIVIGAGPGIGLSVARRFAREGLPVCVLARTRGTVDAAAQALEADGAEVLALTADSSDEAASRTAIDAAVARFGVPDALVYNAAIIQYDSPGELTTHQHLDAWAVNVVGAITAAAHVGPRMAERGSGTILITGGMAQIDSRLMSLSLGKVGVRALAELLDQAYGPDGVHVATVTVTDAVAPGTAFDPADIAEHYWTLHRQPRGSWQREIVH